MVYRLQVNKNNIENNQFFIVLNAMAAGYLQSNIPHCKKIKLFHEYVDPCIHIPHGPSWPVMGIPLPFTFTILLIGRIILFLFFALTLWVYNVWIILAQIFTAW